MAKKLLEVENLKTYFFTRRGVVKAVDDVSFSVGDGETLGLVGESGCGKSVTCLSLLRLVSQPAGKIIGGRIVFNGEDLLQKTEGEMRQVRGRHISMVLQDPMTSLNPVFTIGNQILEAIRTHDRSSKASMWNRAKELLRLVRIPSPGDRLRNYPHELSGGMRQRVVGAISLACRPHLLLADEPTTSLDVTIQAQYLKLLKEIQEQTKLALIFVTHDFGIVAKVCDRVAVMYAGKIVEMADVREIFNHPQHPYTAALMRALPKVETRVERLTSIKGEVPSLYQLPPGCSFAARCDFQREECAEMPSLAEIEDGHWVRCWHKGR